MLETLKVELTQMVGDFLSAVIKLMFASAPVAIAWLLLWYKLAEATKVPGFLGFAEFLDWLFFGGFVLFFLSWGWYKLVLNYFASKRM